MMYGPHHDACPALNPDNERCACRIIVIWYVKPAKRAYRMLVDAVKAAHAGDVVDSSAYSWAPWTLTATFLHGLDTACEGTVGYVVEMSNSIAGGKERGVADTGHLSLDVEQQVAKRLHGLRRATEMRKAHTADAIKAAGFMWGSRWDR